MAWTFDGVSELIRRMEAKVATGFSVSAKAAPIVVTALKHYARERMGETPKGYTVDVWSPDGSRVESRFAEVADQVASRAAYDSACVQNGQAMVTLRQGIRVIAERGIER